MHSVVGGRFFGIEARSPSICSLLIAKKIMSVSRGFGPIAVGRLALNGFLR